MAGTDAAVGGGAAGKGAGVGVGADGGGSEEEPLVDEGCVITEGG